MIKVTLKHYLYDIAIGVFFNNLCNNFYQLRFKPVDVEELQLGTYVRVMDGNGEWISGYVAEIHEYQIFLVNVSSSRSSSNFCVRELWIGSGSLYKWYVRK